jgi:pyroglutamyl-peptidase
MEHRPTILVTGFEPFGGSAENPSAVLAGHLVASGHPEATVVGGVLPVVGGTETDSARHALDRLIDTHRPEAVICFGEAHVRGEVSVERVAVNLRDYRIADNAGRSAADEPVVPGSPDAWFATLPVNEIVAKLRAEGVPAGRSLTAGTFLCNEVMFHALDRAQREGSGMLAGFVHLPQLESQHRLRPVDARPIPLDELLRAGEVVVAETSRALRG